MKLKHVGVIMDGNRRWAKSQSRDAIDGHSQGAKMVRPIVEEAIEQGIKHISFYALSEDNLLRDPREVNALMNIFREFFAGNDMRDLMENGVKIDVLGRYTKLPGDIVKMIDDTRESSKNNKKITVHFALCYDGSQEIVDAAQSLIENRIKKVTKEVFQKHLYSKGEAPDLDLIIRTGGEYRISGFLLWQAKYAELRFLDLFWPEYTPEIFKQDIQWYMDRERRFGK